MTWLARAIAAAAWAAPAIAIAEPLVVQPSYAPRVHPPGRGAPAVANVGYFYVAFSEETPMTGAGAAIVEAQPGVSTLDYHSLAEMSVEDASGQQNHRDRLERQSGRQPGLGRSRTCSRSTGSTAWALATTAAADVQVSADHAPGSIVEPSATPHAFQIQHRDDARWWLTYDGEDLGYYPDTEWTNPAYTEAGFTQWFGEVAAGSEPSPCTQMGNGVAGTSASAASYTGIYTLGSGSAQVPGEIGASALTLPAAYSAGAVTATSFDFGGPGIANTGCVFDTDAGANLVAPDVTAPVTSAGCCEVGGGGHGGVLLGAGVVALMLRRRR